MKKFSCTIVFTLLTSVVAQAADCGSSTFAFTPSADTAKVCAAIGFTGSATFTGCQSSKKGVLTYAGGRQLEMMPTQQTWTSRSVDTMEDNTTMTSVTTLDFAGKTFQSYDVVSDRRGHPRGKPVVCAGSLTVTR